MSDEPRDDAAEEEDRRLRKVSSEELKEILEKHKLWVESEREEGERADLSRCDLQEADLGYANLQEAHLRGANLQEAFLREANLKKADLENANLQGADLRKVNLQNANLSKANLQEAILWDANLQEALLIEANLQKASLINANLQEANLFSANLRGADFRSSELMKADLMDADLTEADLQGTDLTDATGLLAEQFRGANVSGAKLPEDIAKFEGLKTAEKASLSARKTFIGMLAGCLYSWLTIAQTTDARLLPNTAVSPLPIIGTEVPIVGFYVVAPLLLLAVFFYLHVYLQRLWEVLAQLPAVFPDGRPLDQKAYPWILNGLVRTHFKLLRDEPPAFHRLQKHMAYLLAWWAVPLTIVGFWARYLRRHEWWGTNWHIGLVAAGIGCAILFQSRARSTLRGSDKKASKIVAEPGFGRPPAINAWPRRALGATVFVGLIVLFRLLSLGTIDGVPQVSPRRPTLLGASQGESLRSPLTWIPYALERLGTDAFANLEDAEVSTKPVNWSDAEGQLPLVRGADLRGRDLRFAIAEDAFLVNARFGATQRTGADLRGALFVRADLRGASLRFAILRFAVLSFADLTEADLTFADLHGARLERAVLAGAVLIGADLTNAFPLGAVLTDAVLTGAVLIRTDLTGAFLASADLTSADLTGADLTAADLTGANLSRTKIATVLSLTMTLLGDHPGGPPDGFDDMASFYVWAREKGATVVDTEADEDEDQ